MSTHYNTTHGTASTVKKLVQFTATGTVAVTAASTTVTGTGTAFTNELRVGDEITVNSEVRTIRVITSATVLETTQAFVATATGQTVTYYPVDAIDPRMDVVTITNESASVDIRVGESTNPTADGTDLSATFKTVLVKAGSSQLLTGTNMKDYYTISGGTSVPYSIIIN